MGEGITETKRFEEKQTEPKQHFGHHQQNNIYIVWQPDDTAERIFEKITSESFPNLIKWMNINIQEV